MATSSWRPVLPAVVAISLLVPGVTLFFPGVAAADPAPAVRTVPGATAQDDDPLPERPENTGSDFDQLRAYTAVLASREYRAEAAELATRDRTFQPDDAIINVERDHGFATVTVFSNVADYTLTGIFFVDLDTAGVIGKRILTSEPIGEGEAAFRIVDDGVVAMEGTVDADGIFTPADGFRPAVATVACAGSNVGLVQSGAVQSDIGVAQTCQAIITTLCGAAGGAGCWATCAGLALTTGLAGLGCAAICGAIGALGCWGAVEALCG